LIIKGNVNRGSTGFISAIVGTTDTGSPGK
jgi:hypothetical protein